MLFKIADSNFSKLTASPRIPKKRRPRKPKLSKCGKRLKHPAKIQRAVHALDTARYPFQRSQNLFLTVSVKTKKKTTKKRPLFRTAALAKDFFISAFPEEIKKHIGSVKVTNAKQSWIKFNFRRILAAVKTGKFLKDSFLKKRLKLSVKRQNFQKPLGLFDRPSYDRVAVLPPRAKSALDLPGRIRRRYPIVLRPKRRLLLNFARDDLSYFEAL